MLSEIKKTEIPLFFIQAQNDNHLTPTYVLGAELGRLGKVHETRIYPAIGTTPGEGHGIFAKGTDLWEGDVERFLSHWLA